MGLASNLASAKTVYYGDNPETIPLVLGQPTILRFDEPVKTVSNADNVIIKPANDENPDYATMVVEPRAHTGAQDTVFILANGDAVKIHFTVIPKAGRGKSDNIYDVKPQSSLVSNSNKNSLPYVGKLDLLTAMVRGDSVTGYEQSAPHKEIAGGPPDTKVTLEKIYRGDDFNGYLYTLQNVSKTSGLAVDVRKLSFGNPNQALLASLERDELEFAGSGKDKTWLVVVAKPTSRYKELTLPIRVVKQKSGG
jgi:hypothetical protein